MKYFSWVFLLFVIATANAQAPLTSVAHDTTLTGDGKVATPLGVANGGVSTAKIADGAVTSGKLAAGVVPTSLPPNGAAGGDLAGSYPNPSIANGAITTDKLADGSVTAAKLASGVLPLGALRIVDSLGTEVGLTFPLSAGGGLRAAEINVIRYNPTTGRWLIFSVNTQGVVDQIVAVYYTTTDCSGTAYFLSGNYSALYVGPSIHDGNIYEPNDDYQVLTIRSAKNTPTQSCGSFNFSSGTVTMTVYPLSDFGLTPPFHLAR